MDNVLPCGYVLFFLGIIPLLTNRLERHGKDNRVKLPRDFLNGHCSLEVAAMKIWVVSGLEVRNIGGEELLW